MRVIVSLTFLISWGFPFRLSAEIIFELDSCDLQLTFQTNTVCPFQRNGEITVLPSNGLPPFIYQWENDSVFSYQLTGLDVGTYAVTVADAAGCTAVDSVTLTAATRPDVSTEVHNASCFGVNDGALFIHAQEPSLRYIVHGAAPSYATVYDSLWPGGDQFFTVDTFGCQWVSFYFIASPDKLQIDLPAYLNIEACDSLKIEPATVENSWTYAWSPAGLTSCATCPDPLVLPMTDTVLFLTVIDTNGCKATDSIRISTNITSQALLPNAFSPNGDGKNDFFFVLGKCSGEVLMLRIFDRWGSIVFEKRNTPLNDPLYGWDGKYKGHDAASDVYIFEARIILMESKEIELRGDVTLLR